MRRNYRMVFCPEVRADETSGKIIVVTGDHVRGQRVNFRAELDSYDAASLIRDLRRALRKVRDSQIRRWNGAVEDAEGSL